MQKVYNAKIILKILKMFDVNQIVISGIKDSNLLSTIFQHNVNITQINTGNENCINNDPLKVLPKLKNYDAIFIDDDSNWFTVFNELKLINETNENFPLVFICNNNFPNKRRDSYSNPEDIPKRFRQTYTNTLPIIYNNEKINVIDGFYHAVEENTSKNGVSTAIEDFLKENPSLGLLKIHLFYEIDILYLKSQINQKRISIISNDTQNEYLEDIKLSDILAENQLLISYINKYNLYDENLNKCIVEISKKDKIISDYKNKINLQNNKLNLKNSQINGFESNLSLKESQIENIESKLINNDNKLIELNKELISANDKLVSLSQEVTDKNSKISHLETQLDDMNYNYSSLSKEFDDNNLKINDLIEDFNQLESYYSNQISLQEQNLKSNTDKYVDQINSLKEDLVLKEGEFNNQINGYVEDLKRKDVQINSLKEDLVLKEGEFNNQINFQMHALHEKEKILNTLEQSYIKQLSNMDNKKYCIDCFKEEISNNVKEINYLKHNFFIKKIFSPFAYLYLILKSNTDEISLNIKLYRALKDSKCFNVGFYLNHNKDLIDSKWCKFFSPELHYVCNGFDENRVFNKKYFNRNSKNELLEYLDLCDE